MRHVRHAGLFITYKFNGVGGCESAPLNGVLKASTRSFVAGLYRAVCQLAGQLAGSVRHATPESRLSERSIEVLT